MKSRKSASEMLTADQQKSVIEFFKNHTFCSTARKFGLSKSALNILLKKYNILQHSSSDAEVFKHLEKDGYDLYTNDELNIIYQKYLELNTVEDTCIACNIKEYFLVYLLNAKNLPINHRVIIDRSWYDKLTDDAKSLIIDYYLAPHTITDTAIKFNMSDHRIKTILLKANVKLHNKEITEKLGKQKQKENLTLKYGADITNVFQLKEVKEKSAKTKVQKYGDAKYTNRDKASLTCLSKFGATTFLGSEAGIAEIKKYSQEKYGTDFAFLSKEWQNNELKKAKANETKKANKYTLENYSEEYLKITNDIETLTNFVKDKTIYKIAEELNISRDHAYYLLYKNNLLGTVHKMSIHSHYEDEIADFIGKENCVCGDRSILEGSEIDIYVPSKKLGIEFNGTYWHSTLNQPNHKYHFNKSILAASKGIRLIHIYEYEWEDQAQQEKIKLMLNIALGRVRDKIYARQCEIRQISNKEAKALNDKIHLQNHRDAQVTYGLFYNNELVQLMSFSHTKYNKNLKDKNSWEIIRGCPGSNNIVVGGVSKLLAHFIKDYHPTKIFSYCDFNKFNGKSYEAAGMKFIGYTGPDMKWILDDGQVVNRQPRKHAELKSKSIAQIFGSGSKKYLLEL